MALVGGTPQSDAKGPDRSGTGTPDRSVSLPDLGVSSQAKLDKRGNLSTLADRVLAASVRAIDDSLSVGNGLAWLAVAVGAGLLVYFALPYEPSLIALLAALTASLLWAWQMRDSPKIVFVSVACALFAGASLGALHARFASGPQLLVEDVAEVTGHIVRLEQRSASRARLTLNQLAIEDIAPDETPRRIRITVIARAGELAAGDRIRVLARIGPPPEPAMPGARNMRKELFFQGIGATGFSYGRPERLPDIGEPGIVSEISTILSRLRQSLATRFASQLSGDPGILAATLLVGVRDGLSDEALEALRQAGLAHLLAISGMHMAMMTLSAMAVFYLALALHPRAAASRSALRWTGIAGLAVAVGYLALSGASTATQRAFVMIVIALIATMAMRRAFTPRALAAAALIVLAIAPVTLLGPSFQMSFAATLALVATYAAISASGMSLWFHQHTLAVPAVLRRPVGLVLGIAMTSLIAGLATAPFAAYHFSVGAPLSLLGNVLALPLVSLIVMPFGLLALLAAPFGLEALPLQMMGFGLEQVLTIAHWVGGMEGARLAIPAITPTALLLLTASGCLAALMVGKARLVALVPLIVIPFVDLFAPHPSLLVERSGQTVALVRETDDGSRALDRSITRGSRFTVDLWHQRLALDPDRTGLESAWRCDPLGCTAHLPDGRLTAHVREPGAFAEDCRAADILVTALAAPAGCAPPILIDADSLRAHGAIALVADANQPAALTIWPSFERRNRPWEIVAAF